MSAGKTIRLILILVIAPMLLKAQQAGPNAMALGEDSFAYERTWYFCSDGTLKITEDVYPERSEFYGTWSLNDDTVSVNLTTHSGKRGIGAGFNCGRTTCYNEYVAFVREIDEKRELSWSKLEKEDTDVKFPYMTVKKDQSCSKQQMPELPGAYPVASYRKLNKAELEQMNKIDLMIMRNEIYARYGYRFIDKNMKQYFEDQVWYFPERSNVDNYLTDIEKMNIRLINTIARSLKK